VTSELREFVREALLRGMPRAEIRQKLLAAGWRSEEVETAIGAFADVESPIPVPRRRPYLSAREAFFYLVLFVTLYITAFNVGSVLFQVVNRAVPEVAVAASNWDEYSAEAARGAIAGIVIAFPIFLFMSRMIGRSIARDPEKRASKIRKWLTYLTLFVSACVIIGDLTYLVTRLLSGELALRAGLKVLAILLVAGVIFVRYLSDLRQEEEHAESGPARQSALARAAGACVLCVLVAGLVLVGSPGTERLRRIDAQRVEDLRSISTEITGYYRDHRSLPASLSAIATLPTSSVRRTNDPVTGSPYVYQIVDSTTYTLGATFATEDSTGAPGAPYYGLGPLFWRHPAGPCAYTLTVSPAPRSEPAATRPSTAPR
jgi:hypothetical protein